MMRSGYLASVLIAAVPLGALAQPAPSPLRPAAPLVPNPVERVAPTEAPRVSPSLEGPPLVARTGPGAVQRVRIGEAAIAGNEALPDAVFDAVLSPLRGQEVTLAQVEEARISILATYRREGYPFAAVDAGLTPRADGAADLGFRVTEGYIAEVKLEGDIGPAGTQVLRFLERLTGLRPISGAALERALLLASDIPGVAVRGVVRPLPSEPGALQLVAQVDRRPVSGYFSLDNRGSRFAGPWQGLLAAGVNSLTEFGERTELAIFGAEGGTQYFAQASFDMFVGGSGLRLRATAGAGRAEPGSELAAIGYQGDTRIFGASAVYPLMRTRPFSLLASASIDGFESEVRTGIGGGSTRASFDSVRTIRGGLELQSLDELIPFLPAGTTSGMLRLHHGLSGLGATQNGDPDASRSGSEFGFNKATFELQRTQPLFEPAEGWLLGVQLTAAGQYSKDVLPQVEKFYLGGTRLNRGFSAGVVTGDTAFTWSAELQLGTRFDLPGDAAWGLTSAVDLQFYIFRDEGRTWENQEFDRNRRLVSTGIGVRLGLSNALQLELEAVRRHTRRPDGAFADALDSDAVFFRTLVRF